MLLTPHNITLFELNLNVKFPLLRLLQRLSDLKVLLHVMGIRNIFKLLLLITNSSVTCVFEINEPFQNMHC